LGTYKNPIQYWVFGSIYGRNWNQNIWKKKVFEKKTGTEVKQRLIKGLITCSGMGCLEEMGFDFQNLNQNQNWIFKKAPDLVSWFHLCVELVLELYIFFYRSELELKVIIKKLPNTGFKTSGYYSEKYLGTFVLVPVSNTYSSESLVFSPVLKK